MEGDRWSGWAAFGGFMMMVIGIFQVFSGIVALFNSEWLVRGFAGTYFVDISALGWWWLAIGALLIAAGYGILQRATWARVVGLIFVAINAVSQLLYMPIYPLWAITVLILDVLVGYALVVYTEKPAVEAYEEMPRETRRTA
jgi:hypothetical protein